jgi:iron complex outermembrane receptor protein
MRVHSAKARWAMAMAWLAPVIAPAAQAQLDEVTVTARRISESLYDVSVTATVVDGGTLDDQVVTRWEDLALPGTKIGPAGITDVLSIRGMASGINFGFEQSAPVFIDGVWFGSSRASRIGFLDTAQVEVLKGPQPTWYGKNVMAGAFGISTRKPKFEREGWLEVFHEFEHEELAVTGVINEPLGESVALRLAGKYRRMDGFMHNSVDGGKSPNYRDRLARASLRWTPAPAWTVDAKLEYSDNLTIGRETQYVRCVPGAMGNLRLVNPLYEDCQFDTTRAFRYDPAAFGEAMSLFEDPDRPGERIHNEVLSGRLGADWTFTAGYAAQLTLAYYDHDFQAWVKPDHSWNQRTLASFDDSNRLVSQELRLSSPLTGRWAWTAGFYHEDIARSNAPFTQFAFMMMPSQGRTTNWYEDSSSRALFGELEWRFLDTMTLRAGARHTRASRAIDANLTIYTAQPGGPDPADSFSFRVPTSITATPTSQVQQSRTDSRFTPAVSLEWRPQEGSLYYLSWREGFKAGGFSSFIGGPDQDVGFDPETVNYKEAGAKWRSPGGSWRATIALFHARYRDLQVPVQVEDSSATVTRNAGAAVSRGVDVELAWAFAQHWLFETKVSRLDSKYRDFPNATCYIVPQQTIAQGCVRIGGNELPPTAVICRGAGVFCAQDLSGFPTSYSPEWSGTASLRYQRPLPLGAFGEPPLLRASLDFMATDGFYTNTNGAPDSRQGGYATLDARVALKSGRWEFAVIGRNITNRLYANWYEPLVGGGPDSGWFATTARPRQLGLQIRAGL